MATLIISAAASALGSYLAPGVIAFGITGGQLGYFAGSFLGNALFSASPPDIEGPRLSELKVQVSTYGNMLPLTYGTVRQAGNIIWSTDLIEDKNSESGGGKGGGGQEVTTYTYRVNFAVALCEGPIDSILRVWANGTLIFDKSTTLNSSNFRFYNGDETQLPDALIEAYLGVGNVPGYRGVAYVVFENMQLADYGNRIPNLTFEVLKKAASMPPIIQLNLNGYKIVDGWPSTQSMIAVKANGTGNPTQIALLDNRYLWRKHYLKHRLYRKLFLS